MRSLLRVALLPGLLLVASCGDTPTSDSDIEPAVTTGPASSTPTPSAAIFPQLSDPMTELTLAESPAPHTVVEIERLAPSVARLLEESAGPIAVAVVVP